MYTYDKLPKGISEQSNEWFKWNIQTKTLFDVWRRDQHKFSVACFEKEII